MFEICFFSSQSSRRTVISTLGLILTLWRARLFRTEVVICFLFFFFFPFRSIQLCFYIRFIPPPVRDFFFFYPADRPYCNSSTQKRHEKCIRLSNVQRLKIPRQTFSPVRPLILDGRSQVIRATLAQQRCLAENNTAVPVPARIRLSRTLSSVVLSKRYHNYNTIRHPVVPDGKVAARAILKSPAHVQRISARTRVRAEHGESQRVHPAAIAFLENRQRHFIRADKSDLKFRQDCILVYQQDSKTLYASEINTINRCHALHLEPKNNIFLHVYRPVYLVLYDCW